MLSNSGGHSPGRRADSGDRLGTVCVTQKAVWLLHLGTRGFSTKSFHAWGETSYPDPEWFRDRERRGGRIGLVEANLAHSAPPSSPSRRGSQQERLLVLCQPFCDHQCLMTEPRGE